MSQAIPIVLISPAARAALTAEVERGGASGELSGGLLFGCPLDEGQRLVVSSIRLSADVGFGRSDFSLDQTRTSRAVEHAQELEPRAGYCGVWYLHRTPNAELADAEWKQTQTVLEDPDFPFTDLVCLVLCFYYGELNIYAYSFNRHHSSRGQAPALTELRLTTEVASTLAPSGQPSAAPSRWYNAPDVAARLAQERERLAVDYQLEQAVAQSGQVFFRLWPKRRYEKLSFYVGVEEGFPGKAPAVFLLVAGKPYRISAPSLGSWSGERRLADLADDVVQWLVFGLEDYLEAAKQALSRGAHAEAADLLMVVLAIEPRTPGAARLLAKAQAALL